jgi:hypothetical protein
MRIEDGKVYIHQSWLKEYLMCPEKARRSMSEPTVPSDAMILGTAFHTGAEIRMHGADRDTAWDAAAQHLDELLTEPVTMDETPVGLFTLLSNLLWLFEDQTFPRYEGRAEIIEQKHEMQIGEANGLDVYLRGTPDLVTDTQIVDWKTAGRKYTPWEYQRWDVQSATYTWLMSDLLGREINNFTFAVHPKVKTNPHTKEVQFLDVYRGRQHWDWLRDMVLDIVNRYGGDESPWPVNDQGWWCSEKRCTFWSDCKGSYID